MGNWAVTGLDIARSVGAKAARKAKYLQQHVTPNISVENEVATNVVKHAKYDQPAPTQITTDMLDWLHNNSASQNILKSSTSTKSSSVRNIKSVTAKQTQTTTSTENDIKALVPSTLKPLSLTPEEFKFFSANIQGVSKGELEQAINEIRHLHNIKGKCYYTTELSSKKGYSTRALLDARFNDKEHYNDILELIKLNNSGKIKYYPKLVMPNGHTNPLVKQDMKAIAEGRNYYEQLSSLNKSEILGKTAEGDVFSVGEQMFVRDSQGWQALKMDKKTYELLFPAVDRYAMAQGSSNNCGALSMINNLVQVPSNRVKLLQLYEQKGNQVTVHALGDTSSKITFDLNNLKTLDDGVLADTSYGLKMLEYKGQRGHGDGYCTISSHGIGKDNNFGHGLILDGDSQICYADLINSTPRIPNVQMGIDKVGNAVDLTPLEKELRTIGNGKTMIAGGGDSELGYARGTGIDHFTSIIDSKNGNIRLVNPNSTGDYQDVPITEYTRWYASGCFDNI